MMKKVWKIVAPIISAVIGILAANTFNIFDYIPYVKEGYSYEICITAYFAIADIVVESIKEGLCKWVSENFFSSLRVVVSVPGTRNNIETNAIMSFNNQDLSEAVVSVEIKGLKKHFSGIDLVFKKPAFAEMQVVSRRREVRIESDNCFINLEALFGNCEKLECKQEFKIAYIRDAIDGESSVMMYPELSKKKKSIRYKCNGAELRAVNR